MESVVGGAPSIAGSITGAPVDDHLIWPSMQDLNTRLRRVITSYQRNYKKEELKQQQKAKVSFIKQFITKKKQLSSLSQGTLLRYTK